MAAVALTWINGPAFAGQGRPLPDRHAPIGVMGDHIHAQGEWMLSYRFMTMDMEDNLQGEDTISPQAIVTSITNPFPGPPTLRVVPVEMTTQMHMFGLMYAPSDSITLTAMMHYLDKSMDHITFAGMMGTDRLGSFTTESSGIGDVTLALMWGLVNRYDHKLHLNIGLSLPTGDIEKEDDVLTPMNTRPTLRLPYAMQLGSGTYDLEPGITYTGYAGQYAWGAQYRATLRLGENDQDYTWGDIHNITGWGSYRLSQWLSGSLRLTYRDEDSIEGRDESISAPVQTANPDNYGGKRLDLGVGLNMALASGHRFALEYETPVQQDLNGVQMEMQSMLTFGYQYSY